MAKTLPEITAIDFEAQKRWNSWKEEDPFPLIPPALLNSADIQDYVAATGMICPFHNDEEHLKPASYEVPLLGQYVYWEENGARQDGRIEEGKPFILEPNSIAFVALEPLFRLPAYIALRFNLRITHIYRGLLLGTGPLIDPGFVGRLYIPLHNLTTNDYTFYGGEGLIWMEFTKVSPDPARTLRKQNEFNRKGKVIPIDPKKTGEKLDLDFYLRKADPHRPKQSSVSVGLYDVGQIAEKAKRRVTIGAIAAIVTAVAVLIGVFQLISSTNDRIDQLRHPERPDVQLLDQLQTRVTQLERELSKSPSPGPVSSTAP